jgi:uncharacterized membrane protein YphA (DoxX/SURF4 family)
MNTLLAPLLCLAGVVLLVGITTFWGRATPDAGINSLSRFFLVCLRLAIGWHFLVEGIEKLHTPSWSSEPYLREASGPLAPYFREIAGDRLANKLTVGADGSFPSELEIEWQAYLDAFNDYYQLNKEYADKAQAIFDQAKSRTLTWLTATKQPVQVASTYPPPYTQEMTAPERLERLGTLEAKVHEIETDIPKYGKEVHPRLKNAKSDLAKWRGDLKRDLDQQAARFKTDLRDGVLLPLLQESVPEAYRKQLEPPREDRQAKEQAWIFSVRGLYHQLFQNKDKEANLSPAAEKLFLGAFFDGGNGMSPGEVLPFVPRRPVGTWTMLDWSDAIVKYGLVAIGACLLAGLLTRTACVAGAALLLMFFLAMPPLPNWPENPKAEGHYLYINKNVIEMFALLALATMRSGRWAGLDGLVQFVCPSRWRATPASGNVK